MVADNLALKIPLPLWQKYKRKKAYGLILHQIRLAHFIGPVYEDAGRHGVHGLGETGKR